MREAHAKLAFEILNGHIKVRGPDEDIIHNDGGVGTLVDVNAA